MSKIDAVVVCMADGRNVKFGRGEKIQKSILWNEKTEPYAVRFDGRNGQTLTAIIADYPAETQAHATAHGFSQKLGDEYADVDSVADCWATLTEIHERLMNGAWKGERAGFAGISLLLEAVCLAFPDRSKDEHRAVLKTLTREEKIALKGSDTVRPHFDALEKAQAKSVDVGATLAKFAPAVPA